MLVMELAGGVRVARPGRALELEVSFINLTLPYRSGSFSYTVGPASTP